MEITQEVWGFTPEEDGEIVVVYTMTARSGVSASVTNIGASLVSVRVPGRDGVLREVVADPVPLVVNRVWEARIEVNRVVLSTVHATADGTFHLDVAYHLSEEGELEIVLSAVCDTDKPMEIEFEPRTRFDLSTDDRCFAVEGWRKNILAEAGIVTDPETGIAMTVLTSLPRICVYGSGTGDRSDGGENKKTPGQTSSAVPASSSTASVASIPSAPFARTVAPGERDIQKIVYRFSVLT